ncbi:MAG: Type 1 glutamine amidotransferase-like domain-containing protein [Jatrophihabitans sp.]|uniref:Type 1 glutamine amidotransferase-like domain-containing protein n=1 Tax=Jatrophihabitans sp. TaxID=1932789 RepID=UPI0039151C65
MIVDEGDGNEYFARFAAVLTAVAACPPHPALAPVGAQLPPSSLDGADALLVCGGLTPAYGTALSPVRAAVRSWLAEGRPYAGFSAGAAVAAERAVVGGYRLGGRSVCPDDAAEDLDDVTVADGLGLVPFAVEVHAAQWDTLGRMCAAVAAGLVPSGVAIDEDTAVVVEDSAAIVTGRGAAHVVTSIGGAVSVQSVTAGGSLSIG